MRRALGWILVLTVAAAAVAGGLWWQGQREQATDTASAAVQTIAVSRGSITASVRPTGEVVAPQSASLSFDVISAPVTALLVQAGQMVRQGDVLARIDTAELQRAVDQAEANHLAAQDSLDTALAQASELDRAGAELAVAQAEAGLRAATTAREDLMAPDLATAQRAVRDAQHNLESARLNLAITKVSATVAKNVRDLQYEVDWHERNVRDLTSSAATSAAEASAAQMQPPGGRGKTAKPMTLAEAQEALSEARTRLALAEASAASALASAADRVTQAEDALADAQEQLAELQAGPSDLEMAKADNAVAQAEYRLAKAQSDLEALLAGTEARTVEVAQAKLSAAAASLAEAQTALANAVMVAPFDGTVISVGAEVGDEVSAKDVVVTLANLVSLRVLAYIDETEITQVQVGQEASITFEAFSGRTFRGEVLEVPLEGALSGNVVSYEVPISLETVEGVALRPGMTANVSLVTAAKQNVLRLPAYAVSQSSEGWVVTVREADGATGLVPVQIGVSDGTWVEIVRGLNEGDTVLAALQEADEQTMGFGGGGMGIVRMAR